jgi:hypothetical protein
MSDAPPPRRHRARRRLLAILGGVVLGLALCELVCRVRVVKDRYRPDMLFGTVLVPRDLRELRRKEEREIRHTESYLEWQAQLGWTIRPNAVDGVYRANGTGLRAPRDYAAEPPPAVWRIAAFGDSFTHCDEVAIEDSWERQLEGELGSQVEVLNFGVPSYGTDQALLRYREQGRAFHPDVVVLGMAIIDIKRNVNVFPWLRAQVSSWSKPRFVLAGDGLDLVNQPVLGPGEVADAIEHGHPLLALDHAYDPAEWAPSWLAFSNLYRFLRGRLGVKREPEDVFEKDGEALQVTTRIVQSFHREAEADGAQFVCLLIRDPPRLKTYKRVPWQPMLDALAADHVCVVDPSSLLMDVAHGENLKAPNGHYLARGNAAIAASLADALRDRCSAPPARR